MLCPLCVPFDLQNISKYIPVSSFCTQFFTLHLGVAALPCSPSLRAAGLPTTQVAIETVSPLDPSACDDWQSNVDHHRRQAAFLFQRLSMTITIKRFNLVAFLGTFPSATEDET